MTLIVGIRCQDGVVLGADGAATFGVMGQQTIRQETKKLDIIADCVVVGVSGPIGLGQRIRGEIETQWHSKEFAGKKTHEAMAKLREALVKHVLQEMQVAQLARNVIGQPGIQGAICATMVAMPVSDVATLIQFDQNCSPESASDTLPFQAVGSGQTIADPFLAFLRRIFWSNKLPNVQDGVFAALWTIKHAIHTNAGGISEPIQVVVLQKRDKKWLARELPKEEQQEHLEAMNYAESYLAGFRQSLQKAPAVEAVAAQIPTPNLTESKQ